MLLILISWIYILFTAVNLGALLNKIMKLQSSNLIITIFNGLFFVTIFGGFWAIFYRINWEFHCVLFAINVLICFYLRRDIHQQISQFASEIRILPKQLKILLSIITLIIIAKCSLAANIMDNETYYLQTIKWLNEYGFVPGIANLHLYLAQQSGLHLTQAVFSFSFLYQNFNDINGFLLLISNIFAIQKLYNYRNSLQNHYLVVGLFPIANLLLLQFISAPSPDLPIYILTFIIVFYFIETFTQRIETYFPQIVILCLFAVFIKVTSVSLLVFPLILVFRNKKLLRHSPMVLGFSSIILVLFIIKNFIVSGHPLYPIAWIPWPTHFALPIEIANTDFYRLNLAEAVYNKMSISDRFIHWLTMPKLHGFFNVIGFSFILIVPVVMRLKKLSTVWYYVYGVMVLQLFLLAYFSPQYRFFLNFILLFGILIATLIIKKYHLSILYLSTGIAAILIFIPTDLSSFSNNKLFTSNATLSFRNLLIPEPNSSLETDFEQSTIDELQYFSPTNTTFFWATGNAPLPSVSKRQLNLFRKKFGVIPQPISTSINDGFYSKPIDNRSKD